MTSTDAAKTNFVISSIYSFDIIIIFLNTYKHRRSYALSDFVAFHDCICFVKADLSAFAYVLYLLIIFFFSRGLLVVQLV